MNIDTDNSAPRFRFIPYRKHDILEMCLADKRLAGQEDDFRRLYSILINSFHFDFHQIIESLKDAYAPIDPDTDTLHYGHSHQSNDISFIDQLSKLMEKANYERISEADLNQAMNKSSLFKIRLHTIFF